MGVFTVFPFSISFRSVNSLESARTQKNLQAELFKNLKARQAR